MGILKNFIKKAMLVLLAATLPITYAAAFQIGDVVGEVLSTDIQTYINGVPIRSFNIAGRTAIIAQHLQSYGFVVSFDEQSRRLLISENGTNFSAAPLDVSEKIAPEDIGKPVMKVFYTDISTLYEGTAINSFNIEGLTAVYTDDLAKLCGSYEWDEAARTVNIKRRGWTGPSVTAQQSARMLDANINSMTREVTSRRWGEQALSHLIKNTDGSFYTLEVCNNINIEKYDSAFNHVSTYAIPKELELFGGLYCGKDYNYIAFGQPNYNEDDSRVVIKIVVYDKNFIKISEVNVTNCRTTVPFDASAGEMCENDRYLILHTSRSQYRESNGNQPQTQLTVIIDKQTWSVSNELGKFQPDHTSHCLKELAKIDNDKIITIDLSDTAPMRAVILRAISFSGTVLDTASLFNIGGQLAANCTGVSLGGLEISDSGYLLAMSTIDHSIPTGYNSLYIDGLKRDDRDIYLLYAQRDTWTQKHTMLEKYTGTDKSGSTPYIIRLSDGNFMVLWQEFAGDENEGIGIRYALVNGSGDVIDRSVLLQAAPGVYPVRLSADCQPVEVGENVVWYVNTDSGRTFFSLKKPIVNAQAASSADTEQSKPEQPKPEQSDTQTPENNLTDNESQEDKKIITEVDGI